jgi:CelD/BcsL family acetyltransferase involved in cellulose biosynthesis
VLVARRAGALCGALPLLVRDRVGLRVGAFACGPRAGADLLAAPGSVPVVAGALLDALGQVGIDYLDVFGALSTSLILGETRARGAALVPRAEAPVLLMPDGWDAAYSARTSAARRRTNARLRRAADRMGGLAVTVVREPDDVEAGLPDVFRLHDLGWRGRRDRSGLTSADGRAFHRAVLPRLARTGVVRIVFVRIGGRTAAFNLSFRVGDVAHLYRAGFDPAYARVSPGLLVLREALRLHSEEGVRRAELLLGAAPYKLDVATQVDQVYGGACLPQTRRGVVGAAVHGRATATRERIRRSGRARVAYLALEARLRRDS